MQTCEDGSRSLPGMALRLLGVDPKPLPPVLVSNESQPSGDARPADPSVQEKEKKKKRGFFGRLFGRDDDEKEAPPAPPVPAKQAPPDGKAPGKTSGKAPEPAPR